MALESEVVTVLLHLNGRKKKLDLWHLKVKLSLGLGALMYWIATLPSTLPKANPAGTFFLSRKMLMHRCWGTKTQLRKKIAEKNP